MKGGTNRTLEGHPLPSSAHTPPHGTFPSDSFMHLDLLPFPSPSLHPLAPLCSWAVLGVPVLLVLGRALCWEEGFMAGYGNLTLCWFAWEGMVN